jgi:hypothetical protein
MSSGALNVFILLNCALNGTYINQGRTLHDHLFFLL